MFCYFRSARTKCFLELFCCCFLFQYPLSFFSRLFSLHKRSEGCTSLTIVIKLNSYTCVVCTWCVCVNLRLQKNGGNKDCKRKTDGKRLVLIGFLLRWVFGFLHKVCHFVVDQQDKDGGSDNHKRVEDRQRQRNLGRGRGRRFFHFDTLGLVA